MPRSFQKLKRAHLTPSFVKSFKIPVAGLIVDDRHAAKPILRRRLERVDHQAVVGHVGRWLPPELPS